TARLGLDIGHGTTLERYQRWRRFDSVTATSAFDALNRIFSRSSPLERTVRGIGLSIVDRSAALKSWLVDEASGLSGDRPRMLDGCLP
ncbi:MAG TPA: 2-octaprenyl-6-methoxyphenyl hydroxylase, partial [Hyphomicrobiaceae bacterium]|nr:2-octaprenyl-6-methoxyphenyl hydroxylase [Hyphomicrobiaceae bacterium]